jgi:hypothetical protein
VQNVTPSFRHITNYANYESDDYNKQKFIINIQHLILNLKKDRLYYSDEAKAIDLFFAHKDLITDRFYNLPPECPKGYIPWLRENGKNISKDTLKEFKIIKAQKNMPTQVKQLFEFLDNHPISNKYNCWSIAKDVKNTILTNGTREQAIMIAKIFNTSVKSFSWDLARDFSDFYKFCYGLNDLYYKNEYVKNYVTNWEKYVSPDVDFARNLETILNLNLEKKNAILTEQQNILAEKFNNYEIGDYVVIVPTTYEQLVDEGNQQNNCVGRCYHDSIRCGSDWIYFIRHKETPTQSFITCQYSRNSRNTVQYKYKFNRCIFSDDEMYTVIKEITKLIRDTFKN